MSVYTARFKEDLNITDMRVIAEQLRMAKLYGYCPAFASNLPDLSLAAEQVTWLHKQFPGYIWKIQLRDTVLTCVNESLHSQYGFNLFVKMLDNDGKVIRKFGSLLLERFGMPERYVEDYVMEAPKDLRGNMIHA